MHVYVCTCVCLLLVDGPSMENRSDKEKNIKLGASRGRSTSNIRTISDVHVSLQALHLTAGSLYSLIKPYKGPVFCAVVSVGTLIEGALLLVPIFAL